jgi:hypothetical protein
LCCASREGSRYDIYFYAEHPFGRDGQPACYDMDMVKLSRVQILTKQRPPEVPFIEWEVLSKQQQAVEILAATKAGRPRAVQPP